MTENGSCYVRPSRERAAAKAAVLSVQQVRIALTNTLMGLAGENIQSRLGTLILQLLRLRRTVEIAEDLIGAGGTVVPRGENHESR